MPLQATPRGPVLSIATFSHGPSGSSTGVSGASAVSLVALLPGSTAVRLLIAQPSESRLDSGTHHQLPSPSRLFRDHHRITACLPLFFFLRWRVGNIICEAYELPTSSHADDLAI